MTLLGEGRPDRSRAEDSGAPLRTGLGRPGSRTSGPVAERSRRNRATRGTRTRRRLSFGVRSALVVNLLTEDNLPYYYETINRVFANDVWREWARRWTAEEMRHSIVIRDYMTVTHTVDLAPLEQARMHQVSGGIVPDPESPRRHARVRRAPGARDARRAPQHRNAARRRRRLQGDGTRRRRREPALPLLPRPRVGRARDRPVGHDARDRAAGADVRDARHRHSRVRARWPPRSPTPTSTTSRCTTTGARARACSGTGTSRRRRARRGSRRGRSRRRARSRTSPGRASSGSRSPERRERHATARLRMRTIVGPADWRREVELRDRCGCCGPDRCTRSSPLAIDSITSSVSSGACRRGSPTARRRARR